MNFIENTFFNDTAGFMTVRHLSLHGTNFQIGQKLGELAVERYGQTPDDYTANPLYTRARLAYFQRNYPVHCERVRGVYSAFGLDPLDERYDLTGLWYNLDVPLPPMGCSVVYYPPSRTASGFGYLSRNYDFSTGSMADVMQMPVPSQVKEQLPRVMGEPYIMEWYPEDGGYASIAIHAFDTLSGTLDGMNSAGLVVSIMADEEAIAELGSKLEVHPGTPGAVGLHELQVMRFVLDTCATADEAKQALLTIKQYYAFVPCHYIVADKSGSSFIYENSTGRNVQHIIDSEGQPQIVTNFQIHKHQTLDQMPVGAMTMETNAFWRYLRLADRISEQEDLFTPDDLKANNACVNIMRLFEELGADPTFGSIAANVQARTLWHSLYDQGAGSVEFSFYLGEEVNADGSFAEQRSDFLKFVLKA